MAVLQRNGIEEDHLAIAAEIKAAYEPLQPLFKAVDDAADAAAEARAAAEAAGAAEGSPLDVIADPRALAAAELVLSNARALDADEAGPGVSFDASRRQWHRTGWRQRHPHQRRRPTKACRRPFNSWFTLFGQFFDHGLDLVGKGGSGTVFIPLQPDDPLYVAGSHTNFMVLTRATGLRLGRRDGDRWAPRTTRGPSTPRRPSSTRTRPTPRTPRTRCSCASM